jgi:hypothetical protein
MKGVYQHCKEKHASSFHTDLGIEAAFVGVQARLAINVTGDSRGSVEPDREANRDAHGTVGFIWRTDRPKSSFARSFIMGEMA